MKLLLSIFSFLLCSIVLNAQTWDWVQTIRPGGNEYCWDVANDPQGNVLTTGRVKAYSTFGSGAFTLSPPPKSVAETDVFVAKYRANGSLVWANRDGGVQPDWGRCITSDKQSNVFVTGDYCDSAYFGSNLIVPVGSVTNRNIFIAKYDSSGVCLWAKTAGNSANYSRGYGITTDSLGNCYVTGHISGPSNFDGLAFGISGKNIPFIAKFSPSGNCIWVKHIVCQYTGEGNDIKLDKDGNIVVVGAYRGTIYFGTTTFAGNSPSWSDVFITKLDPNGNFIWSTVAVGAYQDQANALDFDSSGNVYVVGSFANDLTFNSTTTTINSQGTGTTATSANAMADIFIAKYNSNGVFQWVKTIGNALPSVPGDPNDAWADDICVTNSNKIIIGGFLYGNVNMASINLSLDSTVHNCFVTTFDTNGNVLWYKIHGGPGNNSIVRGVSSDSYSNIYIGGEFSGTPYSVFDAITVQSYNGYDGLIAKLLPPLQPMIFVDRPTACIGDNLQFTVLQDGYPLFYQWNLGGAMPSTSSLYNPSVSYSSSGTYNVGLIVSNLYNSDTISFSNFVNINPFPVVSLGRDSSLCVGQTIQLDAGAGFNSYSWNDGSSNQTISASTTGQYYVIVSDIAGCSASDTVQLDFNICTSFYETDDSINISLFPNPVIDEAVINLKGIDILANTTLSLFNCHGQIANVPIKITNSVMTVDMSHLNSGVYFYKISQNNSVIKSGKFIVSGVR